MTAQRLSVWFLDLRKKLMQQYPNHAEALKNFQFRDLRAKSGTDKFLQSDREAAQEQLGHSSAYTTNIYIRKGKLVNPLEKFDKK